MRGQAFVVFDTVNEATDALQHSKNMLFYNKPLNVSYAKNKSIITKSRERIEQPRETKKRKLNNKKDAGCRILVEGLPVIAMSKYINPLFKEFQGFTQAEFIPSK